MTDVPLIIDDWADALNANENRATQTKSTELFRVTCMAFTTPRRTVMNSAHLECNLDYRSTID